MHPFPLRVLAALLALLNVQLAWGQAEQGPQLEYRVAHVSAVAGGVYTHAADEWSMLTLRLVNREDRPVEVLCASYFDLDPTQQYGRRIWVPPHSRLQTWYPVRIPPLTDPEQNRLEIHTMVSLAGESEDSLLRDDQGRLRISETLQIARQAPVAGVVIPLEASDESDEPSLSAKALLTTARMQLKLPPGSTSMGDRLLPASEEGLSAFDNILLADDRLLGDEAGLAALRQWLFNGGRLWVMLDCVEPELLDVLLQDESGCQIVDTVTLTNVDVAPGPHNPTQETSSAQFEEPVKLVRVLLDNERIQYVVDGWPAAFTREYGAGQLLVTTLESTAWVTTAPEGQVRWDAGGVHGAVCTAPFLKLMEGYLGPEADVPAVNRLLEPHVSDYVGYATPARSLVLGLLTGFVLVLVGAGIVLRRVGRLEWLAVAGPVVAMLVAAGLVGMGRHHQHRVPPTRALLQLVEPLPGTDHVQVKGVAGLYAQDAGTLALAGHEGGWVMPDFSGTTGSTRRLIRTDLDEWTWENAPRLPGLRTAQLQVPLHRPLGVHAAASFGPDGLSGRLSLPEPLHARDAVIATRGGRLGVQLQPDGQFSAGAQAVLGAGQYVDADLLSDEQGRRSRILAELLSEERIAADATPVLCCWTDPWPAGLDGAADEQLSGAALVAIPLSLERPPAGTSVKVPSPLLAYRGVTGPDGLRTSGLFDHRRNQWTERLRPSSTWLRFQLPQGLVPIELSAARLSVRVTGPIGRLSISIDRDGQVVPVGIWEDPIGTLTLDLTEEQLPQVSADGGILLRIDAGDPDRPPSNISEPEETERATYFQIESLQMELEGVVGEATESPASRPPTHSAP